MCEGHVTGGDVDELIWQAHQGMIKSRIADRIKDNLRTVLEYDNVGADNTTPLEDAGYLTPDVAGFARRMTEEQSHHPIRENAPHPEIWLEVAFSGDDYNKAKKEILEQLLPLNMLCIYIIVVLQDTPTAPYKNRLNRDAMNLTAPSEPADVLEQEPRYAPKVVVWSPGAAADWPSWYVLEANKHVVVEIPTTELTWTFEFNLICCCYEATAGAA